MNNYNMIVGLFLVIVIQHFELEFYEYNNKIYNTSGTQLFGRTVEAAKTAGCDGRLVRAQKDAEEFFYRMGMKKLDVEDVRKDYAHRFWKPLK